MQREQRDVMQHGGMLARAAFVAGLLSALAPAMSVSAWADEHRMLSRSASAEPGRWNTARTPYLREIMDCLSGGNAVQEVVFQKGTQLGGTEVGMNWVGSIIHQGLGPTMIVWPTSNSAKKNSKTRLATMISDTPGLRGRVRDAKSRDSGNTTLLKEFDGGVIIVAGANSATELKSSPAGNILMDEIEEYPPDTDGQGDPEELAAKRSDTFARRKIYKVSTPTVAGGRIDRAYRASDQRQYYLPCPHCGHEQTLRFERLRWETRKVWELTRSDDGVIVEVDPETPGAVERDTGELLDVWYECETCPQPIHEHYKTRMLAGGRWIAGNPGPDRAAGFRLSSLYSPIGWFGWRKVVLAKLSAEKDTTGTKLKTWTNTVLGEAYDEPGESIDEHWLKRRIEPDWRVGGTVPAAALLACAGCDVQANRLEVGVWGYGRDGESWLLDRITLFGSYAEPETWTALEGVLGRTWPHALGGKLRISMMAIDAGDGNSTHFVRAFARKWAWSRRVIAIKGQAIAGKPLLGRPTDQDVNWRGKTIKHGVQLWPVGSDTGKGVFYARLRIEQPGPGYVHLPAGLPDEAFAQLTAEVQKKRYVRGHPVQEWHLPPGRRNEDLDCRIYADAAAERLHVRAQDWDKLEAGLRVPVADLFAEASANAAAQADGEGPEPVASPEPPVQTPVQTPARPRKSNWATGWRT